MMREEPVIDLRSYLTVLERRKWLLFATLLTTVAVAALVTWRLTPIYEGVARVEVQPASASSDDASRILESIVDPSRALQTQVELIKSGSVLRIAGTELGLPSTEELEDSLSVELVPDTQIVELRVEHERPDEARDWANAVAAAYIDHRQQRALDASLAARERVAQDIEEVEQRLAEIEEEAASDPSAADSLRSARDRALAELGVLETQLRDLPEQDELLRGGGTVISEAETPSEPVRPKTTTNLLLAVVMGGMLGVGLAFVAEGLDDRLKSPEEVEALLRTPILGYVPLVKQWDGRDRGELAMLDETTSGAAEAYRTLRINLAFVALERPLKTLLVTGAVPDAGKTTASANLAATLATAGSRVILISADLRRPSVHKFFAATNSKGLMNALQDGHSLIDEMQDTKFPMLKILAAGGLPPNPTEIVGSARFGRILEQLRDLADYIIIDAPPVLGLGDASALASQTDGVLFVLRPGQTTKREAQHATEQLQKAGGRMVGCLLNGVEPNEGYGYYYQYYYTQYQPEPNGRASSVKSNEH